MLVRPNTRDDDDVLLTTLESINASDFDGLESKYFDVRFKSALVPQSKVQRNKFNVLDSKH